MKIRIIKKKPLDEMSAMGAGMVTGHVDDRKEINEATEIESSVIEDNDYEYNSLITVFNTDLNYKIVQALTIEKETLYIETHSYHKLADEVEKCIPNAIVWSYGSKMIEYSQISFEISEIENNGKPITNLHGLEEDIFLNQMDAVRFFNQVMKEIGEYVSKHLGKVYRFIGIPSDNETEDNLVSKRTKIYKMGLKRLFRSLPGNWKVETVGDPNDLFFWRCPDREQSSLVFEDKEIEFTNEEIDLIHELYSTSGAMMGAGSGQIPAERSPEGHKRYVRIRFTRQGLQNFKPNPYFSHSEQQLCEEWSEEERKNRKSKCSNPKGFTMKQFCKNQRTKSKKGEKKNESKN